MSHLKSVDVISDRLSHWVVNTLPGLPTVEWDAEIINDVENERIGWRSLNESDVDHAGSVEFEPSGEGSTRVTVTIQYEPLAGRLGTAVAKLIGQDPELKIADDLQRFKESMEGPIRRPIADLPGLPARVTREVEPDTRGKSATSDADRTSAASQLIVMPAGLLPFSLVLDVLHAKTHDQSYADAAYYTMMGGFVGGLVAGAAGAADYSTIPADSKAKEIGRIHGVMNVGLLGSRPASIYGCVADGGLRDFFQSSYPF